MNTFLKELGSALNIRPIVLKIQEMKMKIKSKRKIFKSNEIESDWTQNNKVVIIYEGKEAAYKLKLCTKFLKDTLNLEPIVYKPSRNNFQINALSSFERLSRDCSAAIVIFSADIETQAIKQSILLELGYFLGKFHKEKNRKIIILHKIYASIPSDFMAFPVLPIKNRLEKLFFN